MELFFLGILLLTMVMALSAGYPVAFALPGAAIISIVLAGITGYVFTGDSGAYFAQDGPIEWLSAGVTNFRGIYWEVERDTLIAIPLFIFMGIMLQRSKIAEDLLLAMAQLFGPIPGGLGISVVFVGALLAATTGIVGATVVAMGLISLPAMMRNKYSPSLATGTICASGTLGQIIPPSIVLIILADQLSNAASQASAMRQAAYREATGSSSLPSQLDVVSASAGDMFLGAFLPGLVLVALYMIYILVSAAINPQKAPPVPYEGKYDRQFALYVGLTLVPPLFLIFLVLGSIISGIATVNQAGSIGAIGAILMASYRLYEGDAKKRYLPMIIALVSVVILTMLVLSFDLNIKNISENTSILAIILAVIAVGALYYAIGWGLWRIYKIKDTLKDVMIESAKTTSMVFIILLGAAMLTAAFRAFGGEELVREFLTGLPGGFWGQFIVVMIVIFLLGFFLDFIEIAVVVVPIVAPILLSDPGANVTAVWLGVMIGLNIQTSFLTPPFGFALFYLRGVADKAIETLQIYRGVVVFICLQLLALVVVGYYPNLVNYLPQRINLTSPTAPPPKNPALQYCLQQHVAGIYQNNGAEIAQAIGQMQSLDIGFLPSRQQDNLRTSFVQASQSMMLLQDIENARAVRDQYAVDYRPQHVLARQLEAQMKKLRQEIEELENEARRSGIDNSQEIANVKSELASLELSMPADWQNLRKTYVDYSKAVTTAQRKYQRNVDDSYQALDNMIMVIYSVDALQDYQTSFNDLAPMIAGGDNKAAMEAIKKNQSLLNNVADSSKIRSLLSKARKELKKSKTDRAIKHYQEATQLVDSELSWRRQAAKEILNDLITYRDVIKGSIGLRLQKRFTSQQAADLASCRSHHRDISLEF